MVSELCEMIIHFINGYNKSLNDVSTENNLLVRKKKQSDPFHCVYFV